MKIPTLRRLARLAAPMLVLALGACAASAPPPARFIAPNPNLLVQGIPPIPASIAAETARYTDFRAHAFVAWHPTRREMLISHRPAGASTVQLFRVASPQAKPEQLTDGRDPVRRATYEPREGLYLVFARSSGGDEADQLYRLDLPGREITQISTPGERHYFGSWLHRRSELLELTMPLDRTAQGGSREQVSQTLYLVDPLRPEARRKLAELPGSGWSADAVTHDDRRIALSRYLSAEESQIWMLEIDSGALTQLVPGAGETTRAVHAPIAFTPDDAGLYVVSNRDGEFRTLMQLRLAERRWQPLADGTPWDIDSADTDDAGRWIAAQANVDGRGELRLFDGRTRAACTRNAPRSRSTSTARRARGRCSRSMRGSGSDARSTPGAVAGTVQAWVAPLARSCARRSSPSARSPRSCTCRRRASAASARC